MKRKSLLFALLLALFMPWAANAQSPLTIGTGTDYAGHVSPYGQGSALGDPYNYYSVTQFIYTASELASMGAPVQINSMAFYHNAYSFGGTVSIYLAHTTAATVDVSAPATTGTLVYTGTDITLGSSSAEWQTFVFDDPFIYNGTDNLLVIVSRSKRSSGTPSYNSDQKWQYTETTNNMFMQRSSDTNGYQTLTNTNYSYTASNKRPNIQIAYQVPATCPKPTLSDQVTTTTYTATISWTPSNDNQELFDIYWSTTNTAPTDATTPLAANQSGTSYEITGLNAATNYYAWIRGNCGTASDPDISGGWTSAVSFATACGVVNAVGYSENFDGYSVASAYTAPATRVLPNCWSAINTTTYSSYQQLPSIYYYSSTNYAHSTLNCLKFYSYAYYSSGTTTYDPQPQYAILPEMDNLANKLITLQARGYNTSSTFKIGTMSNPNDVSTFTLIAEQDGLTTSYQEFEFYTPANCTDNYLAIMIDGASSSRTSNGVYIDDITIVNAPSCIKPTGLAYSNVTGHTVTLSWVSDGDAWQIGYTKAGGTEQYVEVTENPYTLSGLDPESTYEIRVQTSCGDDIYSIFTNPVTFTTDVACPAPTGLAVAETSITANGATATWTGTSNSYVVMVGEENIDFSANFEDNAIPAAFTNSTTYPWTVASNGANNSSYCVIPGNHGVNSSTSDLTLEVTLENPATISFYAKISSEGSDYGRFIIDDIQKLNISGTTSYTTWRKYEYELTTGSHTLIWRYYKDGSVHTGDDYFYVDDITIKSVDTWDEYTTTAQTYTFNTLNPVTDYRVKVKGYCGTDDGYSEETAPVSFTTLASCLAPANVHITAGPTAHAITIEWDAEEGEMFQFAMLHGTATDFDGVNWGEPEETNIASWSSLFADYDYTFAIRKYCSATDQSEVVALPIHTDVACPAPTDLALVQNGLTATTATLTWTGTSESYNVMYGETTEVVVFSVDFEDGQIPSTFTNDATYPWTVTTKEGKSCMKSGNSGNHSTTSSIQVTVNLTSAGTISFNCWASCESASNLWDYGIFSIDGNSKDNFLDVSDWVNKTYELTAGEHILKWTFKKDGSGANNDDCFYVDDITITGLGVNEWHTEVTDEVPFTLEGLEATHSYQVKVQGDCGYEGLSTYSDAINFTTPVACPIPTDVTVSDIEHYTATVNWDGGTQGYYLFLGHNEVAETYVSENFEQEVIPSSWTNESDNPWIIAEGNGGFIMKSGNANVHSSTSEISFTYTLTAAGKIEFDALCQGEGTGSNYYDVCEFYIDNERKVRTAAQIAGWNHYSFDVAAGTHTFKWSYTKDSSVSNEGDAFSVDNVSLFKINQVWNAPVSVNTNSYELTGLEHSSEYIVKVSPDCDQNLSSEVVTFNTRSANDKVFATAGDWGTASNWIPAGAPTFDQTAELRANVTITGEAFAKTINQGNHTITIENGGKLKSNTGVTATVKKTIRGYNTNYNADTYNNGDYYLIANPLTSSVTPDAENNHLLSGNYDLYSWDYTQADEWRNYEANTFSLNSGAYGYLYANAEGTTLTFQGTINAYTGNKSRSTSASSTGSYDFNGWYLLGNSFMYDAYIADASSNGNALAYYKMNEAGDGFEATAAGTPVEPMEGFFCQSENATYTYYVVTYEPTVPSKGQLNMNLRKANKQIDNAILVFGGEQQLGKMTFRANSSKVYMPQDNKDYAIVSTESNIGEMPVNFKAESNGTYTLSFNAEEVSFAYLHLIDNMTGVETDLLANPSYTFEASSTDYESRFKLVFATGNNSTDDNFAYYSNGNWVINNEGHATLQVVDVNGRILKSESINGCANINVNAAAGIYMIRLVNGDNVKVQKVVVR